MGLRNRAVHSMLANPHLAPFDLIDKPCEKQDWILMDHLMFIHKVKESDLTQDDPHASIVNMAKTLARVYLSEYDGERCIVLVKDGEGAQKPAVREQRASRPAVPHIDFCKKNLNVIEYNMMKLLSDQGMKNKLFLVTGAKGDSCEDRKKLSPRGNSSDKLVSFHQPAAGLRNRDGKPLGLPDPELSHISYVAGSTGRPEKVHGVFVMTFAEPDTEQTSLLHEACERCTETEADMLMVELANALRGNVTVCTGDSDIIAVLTASGREGVTLRMDNKTYSKDREMHTTPFGELLFAPPENSTKLSAVDLSLSENRFRELCDITADDEHMLSETRQRHTAFEDILDSHSETKRLKEDVAEYLYKAGIRGSLYRIFLCRFFQSKHQELIVNGLGLSVNSAGKKTVLYIFETLCSVTAQRITERGPYPDSGSPSRMSQKRKRPCLEEDLHDFDLDADIPEVVDASLAKGKAKDLDRLKQLSHRYMDGKVPRGSYGRFLRLCQAGRHIYLRIKVNVIQDEHERMSKLFFMTLCGTDYNIVPQGLGVVKLLTGVVKNSKLFSSWCRRLYSLLWGSETVLDTEYHEMGMKLATITEIHKKTQSTYWTEANCTLLIKTLKFVCELWTLKGPKPGPDYGFRLRDGKVYFDF